MAILGKREGEREVERKREREREVERKRERGREREKPSRDVSFRWEEREKDGWNGRLFSLRRVSKALDTVLEEFERNGWEKRERRK